VSRLAEHSARLDADRYPLRFAYRSLFSDVDANRHLNNGTIGRLFEEGRADLGQRVFAAPGLSAAVDSLTILLATITIEFLREGRYPGSVEVATAVTRVGDSSFALAQAAFQDEGCIALADCVLVKAAERAGSQVRPVPLTEVERDLPVRVTFSASRT
jgi:acyl-CoA thioester hydrolase